jgi:hypothetical protein
MLFSALLLLGVQRGFCADDWPWLRIPLSTFPGTDAENAPGPLTDGAIAFLASHYDIVNLGGDITDSTNTSCGENRIAEAAARLLAHNASVRPFFYLNNIINYLDTCAAEDFAAHHSDLYLRTLNGSVVTINGHPARDISNPVVNAWYASTLSNATSLPYIRGAFCDKAQVDASGWVSVVGEAKAAAIVAGQQRQLDAVRSALGTGRTVVFNGMRVLEGNLSLALLGPHADGGEMEHWLSLEQRTEEGALDLPLVRTALELLSGAAALLPPRTVIMRSMPGPCISSARTSGALGCNWPNNTRPTDPAAIAAAATAHLPFSLAAFLIVAGPRFHMDWGWGYRVNDYVPCPALAPAVAPCYVPDAWFPLLLKAPGTPLAGMQKHGAWAFTRNFSGVNVSVDFAAETASLAWEDGSLDTFP